MQGHEDIILCFIIDDVFNLSHLYPHSTIIHICVWCKVEVNTRFFTILTHLCLKPSHAILPAIFINC